MGYHSRPELNYFFLENETETSVETFGFELEIEPKAGYSFHCGSFVENELTDFLTNLFGEDFTEKNILYFNTDGSLSNGIEIISQVMSFNWFLANQDKFKQMLAFLQKNSFKSHNGGHCGLHFHIGNAYLSNLINKYDENANGYDRVVSLENATINMVRIVNGFKDEFMKVSRRVDYHYCNFSDDYFEMEKAKKFVKSKGDNNRYRAINLCNANTIEIRLMRGTLKWETFFLTFNLINNLVRYSSVGETAVSFQKLFFNGLNRKWKKIANDYLVERNVALSDKVVFTNENTSIKKIQADNMLRELGVI